MFAVLSELVQSIKGLIWAFITCCDIILHRLFHRSLLLHIKTKDPKKVRPDFTLKKASGKSTYILFNNFMAPYNITLFIRHLIHIRYRLKQLNLNEKDCHLLCNPLEGSFGGKNQFRSFLKIYHSYKEVSWPGYEDSTINHVPKLAFWQIHRYPNLIASLRKDLLKNYNIKPAPTARKVRRILIIHRGEPYFLQNKNVTLRRILNEEEVLTQLRAKISLEIEIKSICMETLDLKQQLELANQSQILIGMHGAELAHTLFMPENAALLEIFPCHFFSHYFYTFYMLALARKQHYFRYIQLLPWRDKPSFKFRTLCQRLPRFHRFIKSDYSIIPPQKIISRVERAIHTIESR